MKYKSKELEKFKEYKNDVENQLGQIIKRLQSDWGGKYMDLKFKDYMIEYEIQSQLTAPDAPKQNGVLERRNQTLLDMVHVTMSCSIFRFFLGTCIGDSDYILNNVP